jgi:orotidine-5'-phosphate decarboxylase
MTASTPFGDRLAAAIVARQSQIVLGIDPDPARLWPGADAGGSAAGSPSQRAATAVEAHCRMLIDAAGPACVAVKPQLACFERLGVAGRAALGAIVEHARRAGLLVIADGKRGDIDVTATAYAQSLFGGLQTPFGPIEGLGADLATVNPLMGVDAIEPFVIAAREGGAGVLLLVRTSNPGAVDIEDLQLAEGRSVWQRTAMLVAKLGADSAGQSGIGDVGAVVGATVPQHLAQARELMPTAPFLLPGVGAQGGRVEQLAPAFAPGRAGALISASRSIADAYLQRRGSPADTARAEAERLREAAWRLSDASARA